MNETRSCLDVKGGSEETDESYPWIFVQVNTTVYSPKKSIGIEVNCTGYVDRFPRTGTDR